jgi:hypothetical protein
MPAAKATPKTAPKAPQDRKPKAAPVEEPLSPEEVPGWALMKPMSEIPVWEQTPLVALLQTAFESSEEEGTDVSSFSIDLVGKMAQAMIPYAIDEAAYIKFVSGAGALQRAMDLAMAWVGQMGEFTSSEA